MYAFVRKTSVSGSGSAPIPVTLSGGAIQDGALLIMVYISSTDAQDRIGSIVQTGLANPWTLAAATSIGGLASGHAEIWYTYNVPSAAALTATVNISGSGGSHRVSFWELSGGPITDPLRNAAFGETFGSTPRPYGPVTAVVDDLVVLAYSLDSFGNPMTPGTPSGGYTVREDGSEGGVIRVVAGSKDSAGGSESGTVGWTGNPGNTEIHWAMAAFESFVITTVATGVDQSVVSSEGGTEIVITGTFDVAKTYNVHVGPVGDATDPKCYAGQGQGVTVTPADANTIRCYLPELVVGTVVSLFVVRTDEPLDFALLEDALTVIEPQLLTSQFSMRRSFAPNRAVGRRNLTVFPPADPPTNVVVQSQDMTDAVWTPQALSVIDNEEDPFGGLLGFILREDGTGPTSHNIFQDIATEAGVSAVAGQLYTISMYAKAVNREYLSLGGQLGSKVFAQVFDVVTGAVGSSVFDNDPMIIESRVKAVDLASAWYRLEVTIRPSESGVFTITHTIRAGDNLNPFTGLNQDSIRVAFPAIDLYPLARAYRATGAAPIL